MFKKWRNVIAVALLAFTLAACGDGELEEAEVETETELESDLEEAVPGGETGEADLEVDE